MIPEFTPGTADLVELDRDHPGFRDADYRTRRNQIAQVALDYRSGAVPHVGYSAAEHEVWRTVWQHLAPLHAAHVCRELNAASAGFGLDRSAIPQLAELNPRLEAAQGFRMEPVAGLVNARTFLAQLGGGVFLSTQYMRHPSTPLYTPEPDVVHELIGHAASLSHPGIAELSRRLGRAAQRTDDEGVKALERVYWYTLEFGAVEEDGALKAFGAGLLSSSGELARFAQEAKLLPWDLEQIAAQDYDPTDYQPTVFVAPSFERLLGDVGAWCASRFE